MVTVLHCLAAAGVLLVATLALHWPMSPANAADWVSRDSGVFLYVAQRIIAGEVPYKDVWDHKPPVVFLINAFGLWIGHGSRWGVWTMEVLSLWLALFLAWRSLERHFGGPVAASALVFFVLALGLLLEGGNFTEEYALPIQFGILALATHAGGAPHSSSRALLIGALATAAVLTKQSIVGITAATFVAFACDRRGRLLSVDSLRLCGIAVAGAVCVLGPVMYYFSARGALSDFWSAAYVYNTHYVASSSIANRLHSLWLLEAHVPRAHLLWLGCSGWVLAAVTMSHTGWSDPLPAKRLVLIALLALPMEIVIMAAPGRAYRHYAITALPVLTVLSAFLLKALYDGSLTIADRWRSFQKPPSPIIWPGLAILLVGLPVVREWAQVTGVYAAHSYEPAVSRIRALSSEDDYVLVWGAETAINALTARRSPSRWPYQYPLWTKGYATEAMVTEFLSELLVKKPRLILVTTETAFDERTFPVTSAAISEALSRLRSAYSDYERLGDWRLFVRRDE